MNTETSIKAIALLISPLAKNAYFHEYIEVAKAELNWMTQIEDLQYQSVGGMDFLFLSLAEDRISTFLSLSFVQGIFKCEGSKLIPLAIKPEYKLHSDFVFGAKYRGKTNELLTQMLLNVGLKAIDCTTVESVKLLDPMCGRATTLLWGMRYGMKVKGIEQDVKALADIRQNVKKWCKVHRQKHQMKEGFVGKSNKRNAGKFLDFSAEGASMRIVAGDSAQASELLGGERFHLIVSDLPYGIQHFTTEKTRNPLTVLKACAEGWVESLRPGGAMVLSYNRYMPRREELIDVFSSHGMEEQNYSASHRMSESIVRDVLILRKPAANPS